MAESIQAYYEKLIAQQTESIRKYLVKYGLTEWDKLAPILTYKEFEYLLDGYRKGITLRANAFFRRLVTRNQIKEGAHESQRPKPTIRVRPQRSQKQNFEKVVNPIPFSFTNKELPNYAEGDNLDIFYAQLRNALSVRAKNVLLYNDIYDFDDFLRFISTKNNQFVNLRNCGKKTVKELDELAKIILDRQNDIPDYEVKRDSDATNEGEQNKAVIASKLNIPIEELGFSVRSLNCLKAANIETLGELVSFNLVDIRKFHALGKKSLQEIENAVYSQGLWFNFDVKTCCQRNNIKTQDLDPFISKLLHANVISKIDVDYAIAFKERHGHYPMLFLLYKSLRCLTEREREVVKKAWGMKKCHIQSSSKILKNFSEWPVEPSPPMLLDEIAIEIGLTRERTRQIYEKANRRIKSGALKKIVQHKDWDEYGIGKENLFMFPDDLADDCILIERVFLIEYIQKNWDTEWSDQFIKDVPCISVNFLYYINLLRGMKPYWSDKGKNMVSSHYITSGSVTPCFFVNNRLEKYSYNKAIKEVLRLQKVKKTENVFVPIISYFIDNEIYWEKSIRPSSIEKECLQILLSKVFRTMCDTQIENDCILFKANNVDYGCMVYEILKAVGFRLHRDEIFNRLQSVCIERGLSCKIKYSSQITPLLTRDSRIIPFGRSSYWGLKEWGELIGSIREIALEIVSKSNEPIHIDDLAKRVMDSRPDSNEKSVSSIIRQTTSTGELLLFYGDYIGYPNRKYKDDYIIMPQTFDDWLKAFYDYVVENKHFPYYNQDGFVSYLYRWYFKAGQLTDLSSEEILKFEMLEKDLAHYPHNLTEYNFLHNCDLYKLFVEGNNRMLKETDDPELFKWFYSASRDYSIYNDNRSKYFKQLLQYLSNRLY
jgi:DNA-directed RNA polymerase alpha subunit